MQNHLPAQKSGGCSHWAELSLIYYQENTTNALKDQSDKGEQLSWLLFPGES